MFCLKMHNLTPILYLTIFGLFAIVIKCQNMNSGIETSTKPLTTLKKGFISKLKSIFSKEPQAPTTTPEPNIDIHDPTRSYKTPKPNKAMKEELARKKKLEKTSKTKKS